jgi:hypothetical protein
MNRTISQVMVIDGASAIIEKNQYGFFCIEWNGIKWPYEQGCQLPSPTPEDAVIKLLEKVQDLIGQIPA